MPPALQTPRQPRFMAEADLRAEVTPAAFSRAGLERRGTGAVPDAPVPAPARFPPAPAVPKPHKPAEPQSAGSAPPPPPRAPAPAMAPLDPESEASEPPAPAAQASHADRQAGRQAVTGDASEALAAAIQGLRLASARLAEQARSDALEIAFVIARRILEAELKASPEPLFALVRSAVRRLGEARHIRVRLCPADAAVIEEALTKEELPDLAVVQTQVVADASLSPGDCVVESALGSVDGRLDGRLGELKRAVVPAADGGAS
jgi:flagellar assembly protein FliH